MRKNFSPEFLRTIYFGSWYHFISANPIMISQIGILALNYLTLLKTSLIVPPKKSHTWAHKNPHVHISSHMRAWLNGGILQQKKLMIIFAQKEIEIKLQPPETDNNKKKSQMTDLHQQVLVG